MFINAFQTFHSPWSEDYFSTTTVLKVKNELSYSFFMFFDTNLLL